MHFNLLDILLAGLLWIGAVVYLSLHMKTTQSRIADRMQQVLSQTTAIQNEETDNDETTRAPWLNQLIELGSRISLFNGVQRTSMARLLVRAGWRGTVAVPILIAAKLLSGAAVALAITSLALADWLPDACNSMTMHSLLILGAFVLGMIVPEWVVQIHASQRRSRIEHALPDALDLLVICTNAGYSLGASLQRCAHELMMICPPLGDELGQTFRELQLSGDTAGALRNVAERVGTASIKSLMVTLLQSQQYGTPITQALRQLARSERTARQLRLEEKAAKLSTKITLPMVLFILPAVVLITAGPAISKMSSLIG